ncbi:class I SAM-dependent methyltransferase [Agitococcus lubricus]|uniref:Methyltransferase family protein n=1 Tax=Agitococcus lubricus TaxID=1077255 RepID=A0A2T5IY55_9GAMM|nr:class I SAM-dependent methyltransferase [Agitococcus lubricus]PTQ88895.1 methyltransferase family protein [Agitococcus lubricus]
MAFHPQSQAGAAIYTPSILKLYDWWVHGFSNHYLWQYPTQQLLATYQQYTSHNHLEVGAGTGFFLKQVPFSLLNPRLVLMDINEHTLQAATQALKQYQPAGVLHDILLAPPLQLPLFDSIAFNYVWHCLPNIPEKDRVFRHLSQFLTPNGVLFGATLLGQDISLTLAARTTMRMYQNKGIFGNQQDNIRRLEHALSQGFSRYHIKQYGAAAIFCAWR